MNRQISYDGPLMASSFPVRKSQFGTVPFPRTFPPCNFPSSLPSGPLNHPLPQNLPLLSTFYMHTLHLTVILQSRPTAPHLNTTVAANAFSSTRSPSFLQTIDRHRGRGCDRLHLRARGVVDEAGRDLVDVLAEERVQGRLDVHLRVRRVVLDLALAAADEEQQADHPRPLHGRLREHLPDRDHGRPHADDAEQAVPRAQVEVGAHLEVPERGLRHILAHEREAVRDDLRLSHHLREREEDVVQARLQVLVRHRGDHPVIEMSVRSMCFDFILDE